MTQVGGHSVQSISRLAAWLKRQPPKPIKPWRRAHERKDQNQSRVSHPSSTPAPPELTPNSARGSGSVGWDVHEPDLPATGRAAALAGKSGSSSTPKFTRNGRLTMRYWVQGAEDRGPIRL